METSTLVRVDMKTHARLKVLSGNKSMTKYLEELTSNLCNETPAPLSPIEKKLAELDAKLDNLYLNRGLQLKPLTLYVADSLGHLVEIPHVPDPDTPTAEELIKAAGLGPDKSFPEGSPEEEDRLVKLYNLLKKIPRAASPIFRDLQLAEADKNNPTGELDCGFYHRDLRGDWHLVQERAALAARKDDEDREAIFAYKDYFDSLTPAKQRALDKKLFPTRDFGKNRQIEIDFGKKILADRSRRRSGK